jgi:hypothetical protein
VVPATLPRAGRVRRRPIEGGFALLITVTLLAFLVLLLVGLAAYSRVETAVAGNTQRHAAARQNALLALDVALGQLQKFAGPDQRVTATADSFGGGNGTRHFTGVWNSDPANPSPGAAPLTWLVSGNETQGAPLAKGPKTALTTTGTNPTGAELVGKNATGTANDVMAPLVNLTTVGVPGAAGATPTTIGRYAWWVGDQGVKAPVAVADNSASVTYAPWDSTERRNRLRQQSPLGAGAADSAGTPVFEPRDSVNSVLVANQRVTAVNQFAFLRNAAATAIGLTPLKTYFHSWSPNNFNVLASTKTGGLRQDLSMDPSLLGSGFSKWANFDPANGGYMEDFTAPATPVPAPALNTDPLRRRYVLQGGTDLNISPVLSYALLTFNVRTQDGDSGIKPIEVRARWMFSLWNPYSSALAPENLRLEVTGLPSLRVDDEEAAGSSATFALQSTYGSPLKIRLPWDSTASGSNPTEDRQSWLPGRVYTWTALEDVTGTTPTAGYSAKFYSRNLSADAGQGVQHLAPESVTGNGSHTCHIDGDTATLTLKLYVERSDGDVKLATFTSPQFQSFRSKPQKLNASSYQFSFLFRLAESADTPSAPETWLDNGPTRPARERAGGECLRVRRQRPGPEQYSDYTTISSTDRLLDRAENSYTYNEDTPVFELPRAPILSLGMLQHMAIAGQRPFTIGNSWGADPASPITLNEIKTSEVFDRFFFSGLVSGVTPTTVGGALLLPNTQLRPIGRVPSTGAAVTLADLQAAPTAKTSKYLLQGSAFNVNSTSALAWAAVLRMVRFPGPATFRYLDANASTGTASDGSTATVTASSDAQFFRFSHSAGETYKAETGNSGGAANTDLFRKGMRSLTGAQVTALAKAIASAIATRHAASGPFLSLEEFLAPTSTGGTSLLEQAIVDAGVNSGIAEFSSQWLTQGDIMTALAPVLFPRSDTFVIRTYGEAVNPATAVTEGRAWCEAVVQRVPEYVDKADAEETAPDALTSDLNKAMGRRFKVVSFRWLTRSDI